MLEVTNRLLQLQSFTMDPGPARRGAGVAPGASESKAERGWLARTYPMVRVETPLALGTRVSGDGRTRRTARAASRRPTSIGGWPRCRPDTMDSLTRSAEELGYVTRPDAACASPSSAELPLPVVIEPAAGEFALLCAVNASRVVLADPLHGFRAIPRAEFDRSWDGRALCLTQLPAADFSSAGAGRHLSTVPAVREAARGRVRRARRACRSWRSSSASLSALQPGHHRSGVRDLRRRAAEPIARGHAHRHRCSRSLAGGLREILTAHVMRRISSACSCASSITSARPAHPHAHRLARRRLPRPPARKRNLLRLVSNSGFRSS